MKIAVGAMLCEGNSLTPVLTKFTDFDYAEGDKMLEKIAVTEMLKSRGCDIVPTIYAHALPGGAVIKSDFLRLANSIVDKLTPDLDGVWLYLHGAMCVEELGSAEEALLKMVRDKIGYDIPVSVAMDFHADNSDEIPRLANCVTGYRTAPHCDREETERRAMELLFYMIDNKILPRP
ncbi:MAG: M81 family metallopeptidase, partial [Clostridia bacterium]|nr:M81 family metallopeptidase [Clostridia bacterium]